MTTAFESLFISSFGRSPQHRIFAPGRVNIIGEHTDYNDGFVLPFATSQGIWFLASPNSKSTISIIAANTTERVDIDLKQPDTEQKPGWIKFVQQILKIYSSVNILGFDLVFGGNLPVGAGISSSSALTCGMIAIIDQLHDMNRSTTELVQMAVTAERGYGVQGGIMDQFTIFNGRKNQAILLDCQDNSYEYIDLKLADYSFYLINTQVKHNLIDTDYNQRHNECIEATHWIHDHYKPITTLRSLVSDDLYALQPIMDKVLYKRVSYVVEENERVLRAKQALKKGDLLTLGALLYASHEGLSKKYEVSCPELDWLVSYASTNPTFVGSRMMGGGFGGCTLNLIKGSLHAADEAALIQQYYHTFGMKPDIIPVSPASGIIETCSKI